MGYPGQGRRGKRDGYRMNALRVIQAGTVPYQEALEWQRTLAEDRIAGRLSHDVLLLLEHLPVVTLGRNSHAAHLLQPDRKSTRLNSSHMSISYAVFCLKKKKIRVLVFDQKREIEDISVFL